MTGYNPNNFFEPHNTHVGEVTSTFDPRVITKTKPMTKSQIENYKREAGRGTSLQSSLANQGLSSSMGKSDRLFLLQNKIATKKIKTIAEAAYHLQVTEPTVIRYLKELNIPFNKEKGTIKTS